MSSRTPGTDTGQTLTNRNCLASFDGVRHGRGVIDATYAYDGGNTGYERQIRPGTPMGRITASGLWRPCPRTTTTTTATTTTPVLVDARAFKVGDVVSIGADTGLTITAIDYATNTITIASTAVAAGEAVVVADGSQTCRGILNEFIDLWDDMIKDYVDKTFSEMIIGGYIDDDMVLGDLAAIRAASGQYISGLLFDDSQGQD